LIHVHPLAKSVAWVLGSRLAVLFGLVFMNLRSSAEIH